MKRLLIAYIIAVLAPLAVRAQANIQPVAQANDSTTFRCTIENAEYQVWFDIDFYGQSITDPCLGWEESENLIYSIYHMV